MSKSPILSNITQKWVKLLIGFAGDYSAKLSASELARKTGVPQQTASRELNKLVSLNLIGYVKQGRNKLFFIDRTKNTSGILIRMIEVQRLFDFAVSSRMAFSIIDELLQYCETIVLFGSYASAKQSKDSDIDILIIGSADRKKIKVAKRRQPIEVNEHYMDHNEFKQKLKDKDPLIIEVLGNHVMFGENAKIIDSILEVQP